MRRSFALLTLAALLLFAAGPARSQTSAPPRKAKPKPSEESLLAWNSAARKLIEMAEEFPADKYDYKPTPEVRSFAQLLLHIAGVNYYFTNATLGREVEHAEDDPPREKYRTKKEIVEFLTKSFADGATAIKQKGERGMSQIVKHPYANRVTSLNSLCRDTVEHSGEHYGNLVVYYRVNGMVPPVSRPRR